MIKDQATTHRLLYNSLSNSLPSFSRCVEHTNGSLIFKPVEGNVVMPGINVLRPREIFVVFSASSFGWSGRLLR